MNKNAFKQPLIKTVKELIEKGIKELQLDGTYYFINEVAIHKSLLEIKRFSSTLHTFLDDKQLNQYLAKKNDNYEVYGNSRNPFTAR
jgi:hypothetical protein